MRSENLSRLSERQRQCLRAAARGYSSKEIARQLGLSPSTVNNHIESAKKLAQASERGELARALVDFEAGHKVPSDAPGLFQPFRGSDETGGNTVVSQDWSVLTLVKPPPVGGRRNDLSWNEKTFHIIQIALMSVVAMAAMSLTIAGLIHTFQ